jgi:hypothetical protein
VNAPLAELAITDRTDSARAPDRRRADDAREREIDPAFHHLMGAMVQSPGAAAELLTALASQTRALRLVMDADARGAVSLPVEVRQRIARAMDSTPPWLGTS